MHKAAPGKSGKIKNAPEKIGSGCKKMAPALGLEPRTKWLTATYSTIELRRSITCS